MRRGIAILALAETACFLLLSRIDFPFSRFHIYESLIYAVIAFMLFYSESQWAYMLGILAPSAWILLAVVTGAFGEPMRNHPVGSRRTTELHCAGLRGDRVRHFPDDDRAMRLPMGASLRKAREQT